MCSATGPDLHTSRALRLAWAPAFAGMTISGNFTADPTAVFALRIAEYAPPLIPAPQAWRIILSSAHEGTFPEAS